MSAAGVVDPRGVEGVAARVHLPEPGRQFVVVIHGESFWEEWLSGGDDPVVVLDAGIGSSWRAQEGFGKDLLGPPTLPLAGGARSEGDSFRPKGRAPPGGRASQVHNRAHSGHSSGPDPPKSAHMGHRAERESALNGSTASDYGSEGLGFESLQARRSIKPPVSALTGGFVVLGVGRCHRECATVGVSGASGGSATRHACHPHSTRGEGRRKRRGRRGGRGGEGAPRLTLARHRRRPEDPRLL